MFKKKMNLAITMILALIMSISLLALPSNSAQTSGYKETYPFVVPIDNPVGVGQELLLWFGITDMVRWPQPGWKGLTITVTKPDNTTQTLGPFQTDTTGGTGTVYVPTMVGTHYFEVHFPEQVVESAHEFRTAPVGAIMKASTSEKVPVIVQEDPIPHHPAIPLPTEYWTRPINAQFREWSTISGSYLWDELSLMVPPHSIYQPYNQAPESAHILWRRQDVSGGLAGGDLGDHGFDDGTAYEGKWHGIIIGGVLYRNAPWPMRSHYQGVHAIDLRTGEELWFKPGLRVAFGQLLYWDTFNMHGVQPYLWEVTGSTWKAYDAYSGEWWFTLTNVPSGIKAIGPRGEILVYTIDLQKGYMTMWNSSNVPALYGDPNPHAADFPYIWATWRPYGKTANATGEFPITPQTEHVLPTGYAGYSWNVSIPKDLPGIIKKVRDGIVLGTNVREWEISVNPVEYWALSLKEGQEGQLLFRRSIQMPGNLSSDIRDASVEDGVFVVGVKETRQWYGYSLTTGERIWGPSDPQPAADYIGFAQRNWLDVIAYGKLYSGNYGGILHAYDVKTGELLWTYTAKDDYAESNMGPNWAVGIHFISDGKIYLGHFEHSSTDPLPRGSPTMCIDAETGQEIWKIDIRTGNFMGAGNAALAVIGDGVMVIQNSYDMNDYAIGRGPSATTITAPDIVLTLGTAILIKGTVTDISPGTKEAGLTLRFPNGGCLVLWCLESNSLCCLFSKVLEKVEGDSVLGEPEAETMKKPTSNRSAKERRNTLFRVLDGVLSLSHKKFIQAATVTELSRVGREFCLSSLSLRSLAKG
jgi:outer membrane protein assembly factor BamB